MAIRIGIKSLLVTVIVLAATSVQPSIGVIQAQSSNQLVQSFQSANWSAFPSSASTLAPTGLALGPIAVSTISACNSLTKTSTTSIASKDVSFADVTGLTVGMIVNSTPTGLNEIAAINTLTSTVSLKTGNPAAPVGTVFTFTINGCFSGYFSVNNNGSLALQNINVTQTTNTTTGRSMQLQSCDQAGVGSAAGTWNESANTCSGTINTIMSTIGSGSGNNSPQTVTNYLLPIPAQTSIRLRALTVQSGATYTISISVTRSSVRAANSQMG